MPSTKKINKQINGKKNFLIKKLIIISFVYLMDKNVSKYVPATAMNCNS